MRKKCAWIASALKMRLTAHLQCIKKRAGEGPSCQFDCAINFMFYSIPCHLWQLKWNLKQVHDLIFDWVNVNARSVDKRSNGQVFSIFSIDTAYQTLCVFYNPIITISEKSPFYHIQNWLNPCGRCSTRGCQTSSHVAFNGTKRAFSSENTERGPRQKQKVRTYIHSVDGFRPLSKEQPTSPPSSLPIKWVVLTGHRIVWVRTKPTCMDPRKRALLNTCSYYTVFRLTYQSILSPIRRTCLEWRSGTYSPHNSSIVLVKGWI